MADIKLIKQDTDLSNLGKPLDWDVVIHDIPYYVVRIDGFVHTIGGKMGENDWWAYPRDQQPCYENLIEFSCDDPVAWGIKYEPRNYTRCKWGECEAHSGGKVAITRNGEEFYTVMGGGINYGIDKARVLISDIREHPLELESIDYDKKAVGRKVWFRSQPAIITRFIKGRACVMLEPDGIDNFSVPPEFEGDDMFSYEDEDVKEDIFSKSIWWFRD